MCGFKKHWKEGLPAQDFSERGGQVWPGSIGLSGALKDEYRASQVKTRVGGSARGTCKDAKKL